MGWLYETKGCTLFPDGKYGSCCADHDTAYKEQSLSRSEADLMLYVCIKNHGKPKTAMIMYAAVRIFGWLWWYKNVLTRHL